jgi:hypothetical protein
MEFQGEGVEGMTLVCHCGHQTSDMNQALDMDMSALRRARLVGRLSVLLSAALVVGGMVIWLLSV